MDCCVMLTLKNVIANTQKSPKNKNLPVYYTTKYGIRKGKLCKHKIWMRNIRNIVESVTGK